MDGATEKPHAMTFAAILAGLQAGMLGVCWMLAWLGVSAKWQRRSFWTSENLMATVFYGDRAIHSGLAWRTISGVAVYLIVYSLLGALFAVLLRERVPRFRLILLGVLFSLSWYYVTFQIVWRSVMPLVALLHAARPTMLGHIIYGSILARYPAYLPKAAMPAEEPVPEFESRVPEAPVEEPQTPTPES